MDKNIVENLPYSESSVLFLEALAERVMVLDGGLGTMIQRQGLTDEDFNGTCGCGHCHPEESSAGNLRGCNDLLAVTRPDVIENIHLQYLQAGADIIETDSFNANSISLADYGLSERSAEINLAAARVARGAADRFTAENSRKVWVAGSIGPTSKSLTMAANLGDTITWEEMEEAYFVQAKGLIEGGCDLLLLETFFDILNAKAAVRGCRRAMVEKGLRLPVIISVTLTKSGRTLSGMTLRGASVSLAHALPAAFGINCGFGADDMGSYIDELSSLPGATIVYPNAGLPNELGEYDETPEKMAETVGKWLSTGKINIIGGCCGTTPAHIAAIAGIARGCRHKPIGRPSDSLELSGLEPLDFGETEFVNVGERCNVAGSRKFLRLIKEGNIEEALTVASAQVAKGADMIDINMDDGMLDSRECMCEFLTRIATEPSVARVPFMIDSSQWDVVTASLRRIQGRPAVNSISLKEGETRFLEKAREIHEMGAAMVVMAFDEEGQATTFERRVSVCRRAYDLLTKEALIPPCDIIFDPNILAVATGLPEHDSYGRDFLDSAGWIMENLPGVNVSGGLSNLSFSFRGNDFVRNAMHSIFIDRGKKRGMKLAIVNPSGLIPLLDIPSDLAKAVDDVIENTDSGATERLIEIARGYMPEKKEGGVAKTAMPSPGKGEIKDVELLLEEAVVNGVTGNLPSLIAEALVKKGSAVKIIDEILMKGMNRVGELFGRGEMFLPQVVKSATVMQSAVNILTPEIEKERGGDGKNSANSYRMVIATVKGDVHDIGKNIVDVVMRCNGFDMIDLGVMTPAEKIVETAISENVDCVGLSGLITPSLAEMTAVAEEMERKGLKIPLFIGGATTSDVHTAVKIAPVYSGAVVHTPDAATLASEAAKYIDVAQSENAVAQLRERQEELRHRHSRRKEEATVSESRGLRPDYSFGSPTPFKGTGIADFDIPVSEIRRYINYRQFLSAWGLDPNAASWSDENSSAGQAKKVIADAERLIDSLIDRKSVV